MKIIFMIMKWQTKKLSTDIFNNVLAIKFIAVYWLSALSDNFIPNLNATNILIFSKYSFEVDNMKSIAIDDTLITYCQ